MAAADRHVGAGAVPLAHVALGLLDGAANRLLYLFYVVDAALLHSVGRGDAGAQHLQFPFASHPGYDGDNLAAANIHCRVESFLSQDVPSLRKPESWTGTLVPGAGKPAAETGCNSPYHPTGPTAGPPASGRCGFWGWLPPLLRWADDPPGHQAEPGPVFANARWAAPAGRCTAPPPWP